MDKTLDQIAVGIVNILLVEDNAGDVILMVQALKQTATPYRLDVVNDGEEAMKYLRKQGKYGNDPRPNLILLDWRLPTKGGRECLAEIKGDKELRTIPVIVLSVSTERQDIVDSYNLGANCFITKPFGWANFVNTVKAAEHFWLEVATLPKT